MTAASGRLLPRPVARVCHTTVTVARLDRHVCLTRFAVHVVIATRTNAPRPEAAPNRSLAAESPEHASPKRTRRLESRRPPITERVTELSIRVLAYSAVAAMILILIFIAVWLAWKSRKAVP